MSENSAPVVIDKSDWPSRGPWDAEPDKVNWITRAGLDGMIHRGPGGHLCGYVGVPPGHPWHGVGYDGCTAAPKCEEGWCGHSPDVNVHGGLTYAEACAGTICHVPEPGRPADVWWFGFDCCHLGDLSPKWNDPKERAWADETYKPIEYVRREVESLARQLADVQVPA